MSRPAPTLPPDVARWEPAEALYSPAPTASTPIAALAPRLGRLLAPGGIVCLEIGAGQEKAVARAVRRAGVHDRVTKRP